MVNWLVFPLVFLLTVIVRWWKKDAFLVKKIFFEVSIALTVAITATGLSYLIENAAKALLKKL